MKRFMPRSLVGQIALVMAVTLFVAQAVNFMLILNDRQRLSLAQNEGPAVTRFVNMAAQVASLPASERQQALPQRRRGPRYFIADRNYLPANSAAREERVEERVRQVTSEAGLTLADVHAVVMTRFPPRRREDGQAARTPPRDVQLLYLAARLSDGQWLHARLVTPKRDPWLTARLAVATLLLYILVLGAMILLAARLARPLRDLTAAADRFGDTSDVPHVEPRGPSDLTRAIEAFNAMNKRVAGLLDEKDRMLGALSHDLRTPLASLRIRAENMEPEEERQRVIATIEEMTEMLEDTLLLVRTGRAREKARPVDVAALADAVCEELRELGQKVAFASSDREVASVSPSLLRRAIRNLVENAVKYGGAAEVSVTGTAARVSIHVADRGPGIEEAELEKVQQPFFRLDESRNRDTGGSGLGLTIAKAIAESHGGELSLSNREGGGLVASISIPRALGAG